MYAASVLLEVVSDLHPDLLLRWVDSATLLQDAVKQALESPAVQHGGAHSLPPYSESAAVQSDQPLIGIRHMTYLWFLRLGISK
jgi:hypothetical protein